MNSGNLTFGAIVFFFSLVIVWTLGCLNCDFCDLIDWCDFYCLNCDLYDLIDWCDFLLFSS
jgi:hypothetical protein